MDIRRSYGDNIAFPFSKGGLGGISTVSKKVDDLERERLEALLEEGYKPTQSESLALAKEFKSVDIEGWDEY